MPAIKSGAGMKPTLNGATNHTPTNAQITKPAHVDRVMV
jgi:hypothetical protein